MELGFAYNFGLNPPCDTVGPFDWLLRDGKSLQNSTDSTSSLKNQHTKYMQKTLKKIQKQAKMTKIALKGQKKLNCVQKPKITTAVKK